MYQIHRVCDDSINLNIIRINIITYAYCIQRLLADYVRKLCKHILSIWSYSTCPKYMGQNPRSIIIELILCISTAVKLVFQLKFLLLTRLIRSSKYDYKNKPALTIEVFEVERICTYKLPIFQRNVNHYAHNKVYCVPVPYNTMYTSFVLYISTILVSIIYSTI